MRQPTAADLRKHERVKFQLRLVGSSLAEVSRRIGVTQGAVCMVSIGRKRSKIIEAAIAAELGQSPEELWPKRYPERSTAVT